MRAPRKGAVGGCRRNRRHRGERPEWVRPYRRAQRALDASAGIIFATFDAAMQSEDGVKRRPVRCARRLNQAIRKMAHACLRVAVAARELNIARECLSRAPHEQSGHAPELLELVAERCQAVANYIPVAVAEAAAAQLSVLAGLESGELVPEHPSDSRPRIILKPRPAQIRAFLSSRTPRVADRITPLLRQRRRTPRPAEVRVPRPSVLGRAPPLSSTCPLHS